MRPHWPAAFQGPVPHSPASAGAFFIGGSCQFSYTERAGNWGQGPGRLPQAQPGSSCLSQPHSPALGATSPAPMAPWAILCSLFPGPSDKPSDPRAGERTLWLRAEGFHQTPETGASSLSKGRDGCRWGSSDRWAWGRRHWECPS